jgi:hypothetical protein
MTTAVRLGQLLREARETRGFTVEQLSAEAHIPVGHIHALEAGLVHSLPGAMYRRAEARAYADAVGLDPQVVLAELQRALAESRLENTEARGLERENESAPVTARNIEKRIDNLDDRTAAPGTMPSEAPRQARSVVADEMRSAVPVPRLARAAAVLVLGCAALIWQQNDMPEHTLAPAATLPAIDAAEVFENVARMADPPPAAPTLTRALYDPRIAANGRRWPRDGRLDEGVLVVHSTPRGARVTVNGVGWGVTPVAIRYLPLGALRVRINKADYGVQERIVTLSAAEPTRMLRVSLPELARRRAAPAPAATSDMLVINTTPPGARVTVNGIGWGVTPVTIAHVPAGTQRVRVVKDQFESEERVVTVRDGQPSRVAIQLKPAS